MSWRLHRGDCLELMAGLEPESVDALVCDPPYGLGKPPPIEEVLSAWLAGDTYEVSGGGFMGRRWDAFVPGPHFWRLAFAAMKPGAHGVVFAGQRTIDVMGIALRLAGFEVRDLIGWQYWSGFPKSHDVSKAIDRAAGAEREVVGIDHEWVKRTGHGVSASGIGMTQATFGSASGPNAGKITAPATPDAARWEGWGTALKPSIEPALLIRKPLSGTVAANVLRYGTGGLNVDGCRYPFGDQAWPGPQDGPEVINGRSGAGRGALYNGAFGRDHGTFRANNAGRWPANVYACPKASTAERERGLTAADVLCQCEEVAWDDADQNHAIRQAGDTRRPRATIGSGALSEGAISSSTSESGSSTTGRSSLDTKSTTSTEISKTTGSQTFNASIPSHTSGSTLDASAPMMADGSNPAEYADSTSSSAVNTGTSPKRDGRSMGGADRATSGKSSKKNVCDVCGRRKSATPTARLQRQEGSAGLNNPRAGAGRTSRQRLNFHETVKPVRLLRWLSRLVTPPGGTVLDPFAGSGSCGVAAVLEGLDYIGAELEADYQPIAEARIAHAVARPDQWLDTRPGLPVDEDTIEAAEAEAMGQIGLFGGGE